jgi:hypothetical protein
MPALVAGCLIAMNANAVTMQVPFSFRSDRTANSLGLMESSIVIGVNGVTPHELDGSANGALTTVTATQGATTIELGKINAAPSTPFFNSYIAQIAYDPALTGQWAVTASNPATTPASLTLNTIAFGDVASVPFVASMALSGAGTALELDWVQPATNDRIDRQTLFVFEQQPAGNYQLIFSQELGTVARAFNLGSIPGLDLGTNYVISIDTSDNAPGGNTVASSASYFNFTPTAGPVDVYLPSVGEPGISHYNIQVQPEQPVALVTQGGALGYDFTTTAGGPRFETLSLPNIGDGAFDLWLFDDFGEAYFAEQLLEGTVYDFGLGGVSAFRLFTTGDFIAPTSTTDFSLQASLTFSGAGGTFTGSVSALTADPRPPVAVPEPTTLSLLGLGFGLLALRRRVRTRQSGPGNSTTFQ